MIVPTHELQPDGTLAGQRLDEFSILQTYCGLDCCLTLEVLNAITPLAEVRPRARSIYDFERSLQAPYLEVMLRGFLVDQLSRHRATLVLRERLATLQCALDQLAEAAGTTANARSHKQLKELFYEALGLPEIWTSKRGERKLSLDRTALETLHDRYLYARPFVNCILSIRDLSKQLEVFESDIDSDGRFRASYNIAGTETGRPSSSTNAFGTGGNAQNIAPNLRYVFVADPGWKLCVIDQEQAEARDVGWIEGCLFGDWTYLDACESGDLHTNNARRIWPEEPWTDDPKENRRLADRQFYREFSYRDMAKRGSHLSNYMGTAWTAARALKVPQSMMEDFQHKYCRGPTCAFPAHARWWQWCAEQLQTTHLLVTPFGRERHFFGRPNDDTTLRESIAFLPQSTTSDRNNLFFWRIWRHLPEVQLLAQGFDSVTFQYPEELENDSVARALDLISIPFVHPSGRRYIVPGEAKIGWNWGYASPSNPEGLAKWSPNSKDPRKRRLGLDRIMA